MLSRLFVRHFPSVSSEPPPPAFMEARCSPRCRLAGRSPLLRLQSDERLVALIRRGHHGAFEALVQRYQPRLLAFCRHMLGSTEDAEDVLQEVFAAAFNAICADDRPINARPWLYRIARNRCLNHLRRPQALRPGLDGRLRARRRRHHRRHGPPARGVPPDRGRRGRAAGDPAHRAAAARDRRALVRPDRRGDGHDRAEREVAARARARVARRGRRGAPAHLRRGPARARAGGRGDRRTSPRSAATSRPATAAARSAVELRKTNKALAAVYPIGPLLLFKKLWIAKLGFGGERGAGAARPASGGGAAAAWDGRRAATAAGGDHRRRSRVGRRLDAGLQGRRGHGRGGDRHRRRGRGEARGAARRAAGAGGGAPRPRRPRRRRPPCRGRRSRRRSPRPPSAERRPSRCRRRSRRPAGAAARPAERRRPPRRSRRRAPR